MKIRISGFELTLHKQLTVDELADELNRSAKKRFKFHGQERVIRSVKHQGFVLGCISTDKGYRQFPQMDKNDDKISVHGLARDKSMSAFNFFLISRSTGRGMATHYSESGGLPLVCGAFEKFAASAFTRMRKKALTALGRSPDRTAKARVEKDFQGVPLDWHQILTRAQFEAVLKSWERIKAVMFRFKTPELDSQRIPEDRLIRTREERMTFVKAEVGQVANFVSSLVKNPKYTPADVARVEGVNAHGGEVSVDVHNIPDWFGELEYEKVIGDTSLFDADLTNSVLIRVLLKEAADRASLF